MPQVFVRLLDGKTATVNVDETATVADLRRAFVQQHPVWGDRRWGFRLGVGTALDDDVALAPLEFGTTFNLLPPPVSLIDNVVVGLLHRHLRDLLHTLAEKHFIFIGVGSYDHNHGEASIKRQQCRDAMFDWCARNGWKLTILLIDPGFHLPDTAPQIYHVATKGWSRLPVWATDDNNVRQYINGMHPIASVWTFATGTREYDPLRSLTDPTSIHGLDFRSAFENEVRTKRLRRCCLVMGNFYQEPTPTSQYTTVGEYDVLQACGFTPTA